MRMVLEILRYFLFHVPQQQSTDNWNEHEKKQNKNNDDDNDDIRPSR